VEIRSRIDVIFGDGVLAHAIAASDEVGILDEIAEKGSYQIPAAHAERAALAYICRLLAAAGILDEPSTDSFRAGGLFEQTLSRKAFFTWLFSASGTLLARAGSLLASGGLAADSARNSLQVATTSAEFGRLHLDPTIQALPELATSTAVADLGCGDGSRLISLAGRLGVSGLGVDISQEAIGRARRNAASAGLDRLQFVIDDARSLGGPQPGWEQIDVLMSFLMGHDLWPRADCIATLRTFRSRFPAAQTLVLGETVRSTPADLATAAIPTVGYEYLHALMGQYIPSFDEWIDTLYEGGWAVRRTVPLAVPALTWIFVCEAVD
jgi:SAM-dependent methyltransferase